MDEDEADPGRGTSEATTPIVGIGASAGGIHALRSMLPEIPPHSGQAFVVVMHLDPDHGSQLPEILSRSTRLSVAVAEDGLTVEPDHVYVIAPGTTLTVADGRLVTAPPRKPRIPGTTIDDFLISLARDRGPATACVILSGTGSDGTQGLRAVKEAGGLTIAQAGAEYDGMMRSAVATGLVDHIMAAEDIPARLAAFFSRVDRYDRTADAAAPVGTDPALLQQIATLLHKQTGHDFSKYKERTIIRRVQRRMHVLQIDSLSGFTDRLRRDPPEATRLFQDLLIGVTDFFRDPDVFATLERTVIAELFRGKGPSDTIRVWVPGCATGEEAYSLAILLREYADTREFAPRLQVFATDIDEQALEIARVGRYPAAIANSVTPQRLDRYFQREDGTYRVIAELRENCLFASHNLLQDAPFSRLDMISCRNLLIYLRTELHGRVIPLFHYSLNQGGYLLLGTSENVTQHSRLFVTVDKGYRIFQRRAHLERQLPEFPLTAPETTRRVSTARARQPALLEATLRSAAERQLLDRFAPAYVIINAEGDVLQTSGRTGKYLELPAGAPDTNIYSLARSGLRLELRATVQQAVATGQAAVQHRVVIGTDGGRQELDLHVQPLHYGGTSDPLYMIVFQDVGTIRPSTDPDDIADPDSSGDSFRQLEAELRATTDRLQVATEELESSNEELKSSNEELSSINEELQSANEELETSKEELQSINEELQTVNAELSLRVEELSHANNDISNLLESTQIATVFLDRGMMVKSFTPAAKDVFRLVESDAGRPIMHVRPLFVLDSLQQDADRVLRTLATTERQVTHTETGASYILRILPYLTTENVINGVVMTFTDVTRITQAEARIAELTLDLQARVRDLETLLDLVPVGVMIADGLATPNVVVNQYGARLLGEPDGISGLRPATMAWQVFDGEIEVPLSEQPLARAMRTRQAVSLFEARLVGSLGHVAQVMISAVPLLDASGAVRGAISALADIAAHKRAAAEQLVLLNELQHRVKNILATVVSIAGRIGRGSATVGDFQAAFLPRLAAMARMHDLLSSGAWQSVDLRALLLTALDLHVAGTESLQVTGEAVELSPSLGPTLGMVFYELATNAAKYGALASETGMVDVSWTTATVDDQRRLLRLIWQERGGGALQAATHEGFGTAFIRRSVEYDLDGSLSLELAAHGLRCQIEIPLVADPAARIEQPPQRV